MFLFFGLSIAEHKFPAYFAVANPMYCLPMKKSLILSSCLSLLALVLTSCDNNPKQPVRLPVRAYTQVPLRFDTLRYRQKVYVPIYAEIFYSTSEEYYPLLTTLSIRNTSMRDSMYVQTVDYYDTEGKRLKQYLSKPIALRPLQSVEFPVTYADQGGAGANFIVDWGSSAQVSQPMIQAVTVGSAYRMGFSWITDGVVTDSVQR